MIGISLIGLLLTLPLIWLFDKYLKWPGMHERKGQFIALMILLPLSSYFLLTKLDAFAVLPVLMGVILLGWVFEVGRGWRKAVHSGLLLRLGRSRFQKFNLMLAAGMAVLMVPALLDLDDSRFSMTMFIWLSMIIMQSLVPNYMAGAGVFLNGSLLRWEKLSEVSWRAEAEPLVLHSRSFLGKGQLPVPVRDNERDAVESILQRSMPTAAYSPIAGS
jgi:hypothetical protein